MYESDPQKRIASLLIDENPPVPTATLSSNKTAVVVEVEDLDAAYTANEARDLALSMEQHYEQRNRGSSDHEKAIEKIRTAADIVDIRTIDDSK
jgi:hypothetical protein